MAFRDPLQERRAPLIWAGVAATIVAALIALSSCCSPTGATTSARAATAAARNEFDELIEPVAGVLATPVRWLADGSTEVKGYFFAGQREPAPARAGEGAGALARRGHRAEERQHPLRGAAEAAHRAADPLGRGAGGVGCARALLQRPLGRRGGGRRGEARATPVMTEHGLVGRVVGVSKDASRVLLLTDVESRMPVLIDRNNARSILTGDGGPSPRLEYLRGQDPVHDGDLILTSGDGGVYPRGLPVGVAARDLRGVWRVRLYADREAIDYVRMLEFQDFGKLVDAEALAAKSPPPLDPAQQAQLEAALAARAKPLRRQPCGDGRRPALPRRAAARRARRSSRQPRRPAPSPTGAEAPPSGRSRKPGPKPESGARSADRSGC